MGRSRLTIVSLACCAALAAGAVAGCADKEPGVEEPAREGLALDLGGIDYNVFITRQLNFKVPPDSAYYKGPAAKAGNTFYGVFLQACNFSEESHDTVSDFKIEDHQGNEFEPTELPEDNEFAYHPKRLQPDTCIPEEGSVTQLGPTAGALLLFELPLEITENRPLELKIEGGFDPKTAEREHLTFELDI